MRTLILHCKACKCYTLSETCGNCSLPTSNPLPPRFSPQDKYGKYRRMLRSNK